MTLPPQDMRQPRFFTSIALGDLAAPRSAAVMRGAISHAVSLPPAKIALPPLTYGQHFLTYYRNQAEPHGVDWQAQYYGATTPGLFVLRDAIVHSSAGIVCVGGQVITETLEHTAPELHHYAAAPDGIWLDMANLAHHPGPAVSALCGSDRNYFHALLDGLGKLAVLPPAMLAEADTVMLPTSYPALSDLLAFAPAARHLRPLAVARDQTYRVANLYLAQKPTGQIAYHPCLVPFFGAIAAGAAAGGPGAARPRLYIDRRFSAARPLLNEAALIDALAPLGVQPVRLETLSLAAQARLFSDAALIVAPHGAGLTNLIYAPADCAVLELLMDAYMHAGFRHLSALGGQSYDCIMGRAQSPWPVPGHGQHRLAWEVSIPHVLAAVRALGGVAEH